MDDKEKIFRNCQHKNVKHYLLTLYQNGYSENDAYEFIIESLYYIPRRDILYECTIDCESYKLIKFGKVLDCRRVFLLKLYNEHEEKDFFQILKTIQIVSANMKSDAPLLYLDELVGYMTNEKSISEIMHHFERLGKANVRELIKQFREFLNSRGYSFVNDKDTISENDMKKTDCKKNNNLTFAIEKGDDNVNPSFGTITENGETIFSSFEKEGRYQYPEEDTVKSMCVVINNYEYANRRRSGSDSDVKFIKDTFGKLFFKILVYENKKKDELFQIADNFQELSKPGAMFVCFIMAHGERDVFFDIDENPVNIREFSLKFSAKNCTAYVNKPKVFFVQACQGKRYHQYVTTYDANQNNADNSVSQQCNNFVERDGRRQKFECCKKSNIIPEEADFIYGMATVEDCVAFRSVSEGSFFITELCKLINSDADKCDVVSILTKVISNVSQIALSNVCQLPTVNFTVRKRCFLKRPS